MDLINLLQNPPQNEDDTETVRIFKSLEKARLRQYLTREELLMVVNWKSERARPLVSSNSKQRVIKTTRKALRRTTEKEIMRWLRKLNGVSFSVASAVLTFLKPERYGVLDFRVWRALRGYGMVKGNPSGRNFTEDQWIIFLSALRVLSGLTGLSTRDVERQLFDLYEG